MRQVNMIELEDNDRLMCVDITERLHMLADDDYRIFQSRLVPNVLPEKILGVRIPQLRKFAREIHGSSCAREFIANPSHTYYDENNLHGILIGWENDYELTLRMLNEFLPFVDNWATCDIIAPRIFSKYLDDLSEQIDVWLGSEHTYTVRFGVDMLIRHYTGDHLSISQLEQVAGLEAGDYYIDMAAAWYFATVMIEHPEPVLTLFETGRLNEFVCRKAIQKAIESYRIPDDLKAHLRLIRERV